MRKLILLIILILFTFVFSCEDLGLFESEGAWYYGPVGYKACVNTTEDDCTENFKGSWHKGEECK